MIGKYISLALLIAISVVQIISLCIQNRKLKSITKIFILPLIISFYCFSTQTINWFVVSALLCGWVGDIILIPKSKTAVVIGGWLFLAEQILLTITLISATDYSKISLTLPICLSILFLIISVSFCTIFIKKYVKTTVFVFGCGYLTANGLTNAMALSLLISAPNLYTGLLFVGTLLFFISDTILVYVRMTKNPKFDTKHIIIMSTYMVAQFLIAFSFI